MKTLSEFELIEIEKRNVNLLQKIHQLEAMPLYGGREAARKELAADIAGLVLEMTKDVPTLVEALRCAGNPINKEQTHANA